CDDAGLAAAAQDGVPPFVSASLADSLGPGAVLRTDVGRISLDGAPRLPGLEGLSGGRAVVMPIARAQSLFARPGFIDAIYVQPKPDVDIGDLRERLESVVGPVNGVLGSDDPPPVVGVL